MSSTTAVNSQSILSTDGKCHITLIYLIYDDEYRGCEYYGGGYYAEHFNFGAGVGGKSLAEMMHEAYDVLEEHIEDKQDLPFDIKKIKESVVFDLVECLNEKENWAALHLLRAGAAYEEISQAVRKMRSEEIHTNASG